LFPAIRFDFFGGTNVVTCTANYGTNSVSCSFNIVVIVAPSITQQPQNVTVSAGQSFSLSVDVAGTLPMSYQWLFQGKIINGANTSTLTITNAQSINDGVYSVFVYNDAGSTNSSFARSGSCPLNRSSPPTLPRSPCQPVPMSYST